MQCLMLWRRCSNVEATSWQRWRATLSQRQKLTTVIFDRAATLWQRQQRRCNNVVTTSLCQLGKNAHYIMPWTIFEPEFLIIWRISFKWQLTNEFFVSKANCDGNTLLPSKNRVEGFTICSKINNALAKNFAFVN